MDHILTRYESEEMFMFYSRGFNGVVNGYWVANQYTEACSAFLDVDFLNYALSIPPALKYKAKIYRQWILARHPLAAKYIWEKTRARISANDHIVKIRRLLRLLRSRILGQRASDSMNPFDYWYRTNPRLPCYMDSYFKENIERLDKYPELKVDCQKLFARGRFEEKAQCLTLLEAIKLHFSDT